MSDSKELQVKDKHEVAAPAEQTRGGNESDVYEFEIAYIHRGHRHEARHEEGVLRLSPRRDSRMMFST
jgi:hypothetical protein